MPRPFAHIANFHFYCMMCPESLFRKKETRCAGYVQPTLAHTNNKSSSFRKLDRRYRYMSSETLADALAAQPPGPPPRSFRDLLKCGHVRVMPSLLVAVDATKQSVTDTLEFLVSFFGATKCEGGDSLSNRTVFLGPRNEYESRLIPLTDDSAFKANVLIARLSFAASTPETYEEAVTILIRAGFQKQTIDSDTKVAKVSRMMSPFKSFVVYVEWLAAGPKPARPGIGQVARTLARTLVRAARSSAPANVSNN